MAAVASDVLAVRLHVGRRLRGPALVHAVVRRNLLVMLLSMGLVDYVAPAWVVVTLRATGDS